MLRHVASLSFAFFCLLFYISTVTAADSNIYVECSQVFFTPTTPYETNVNSLFTSLVDSASITNFNKFEISETNIVYGLYQCRGDLSSSYCNDCVASSVNQLKKTCPVSVGGAIQLDGCFVKYNNTPFFGVENKVEVLKRCGPSIGYNSDILNRRDNALVSLIAGNGQYFHGGDYGSIQGVAQCVQDVSLTDCQDCLSEASGRLRSDCETSSWGQIYLGTCYVRYRDRDNSNSNDNSKNGGSGNNKNNLMKLIGYLIPAIVGAGITFTITISLKNSCNTNNHYNNKIELKYKEAEKLIEKIKKNSDEADKASRSAEDASKKAEQASERAETASQNAKAASDRASQTSSSINSLIPPYHPSFNNTVLSVF